MGREIELKLEAAPDAAAELARQPWAEASTRKAQQQRSLYFDTPDGELRRKGYALRVRAAGGCHIQALKSLDNATGLTTRGEWEWTIGGPEPDVTKLADTPVADLKLDRLEPVVETEVKRTSFLLHGSGAEIELDFDEGRVSAADRELPVSEMEIELIRGEPRAAAELARRIAADVPVKLAVMSKAERGFALVDDTLSRCKKSPRIELHADMTIAEGFETIVASCIRHFRLNEPLVIGHRHTEALHQTRVALRRLRSAFSLFKPVIADREFNRLDDELRCFTNASGDARNLDVYLQRDLTDAERRPLEQRREEAYDTAIAVMNSAQVRRLMVDVVAWAAVGQWRSQRRADRPLNRFIDRRIDRLWKKTASARQIAQMSDMRRHHLRIGVKKLRYALDFSRGLHQHHKKRRKSFGKSLKALQDALGQLNDAVVARGLKTGPAWPLTEPQHPDERQLLRDAKYALRQLRKIGCYWND